LKVEIKEKIDMKFNHQFKLRSSILIMILSLVAAFGLAGCGSDAGGQTAGPKTQVTVQMGWVHEYSAAGYYAAERNGHFAEQNLEVQLQEGGFNEQGYINPVAQVLAGEADFGATSASDLILARAEGKPIVAIATVLQRSPFALISLAENKIVHPLDLVGKRVAVSDGGAAAIYKALLISQGIDLSQVNTVPRTSFGIDPLTNKEVDVLGGWIINEGVLVQEAGLEPNFILSSDYGIDTYDSLIFTTEAMIAERPEVVERFLRAIVAGLHDVAADPEQGVEFALTYNDKLVLEEQQRRMRAWLPLMKPAGSSVGMMHSELWELTRQILLDQNVLSEPIEVKAAYDLTFLEKIYNHQAAN
jgi:NitT/TauT family transport system substrate-binding protein